MASAFLSLTKTEDELSIVCVQSCVPDGVECNRDWRALRVVGKLDFNLTGVLSSLAAPLAEAKISVFAISTFDTDYLLLKEKDFDRAVTVLKRTGHAIAGDELCM
jgi:hypothetical protein